MRWLSRCSWWFLHSYIITLWVWHKLRLIFNKNIWQRWWMFMITYMWYDYVTQDCSAYLFSLPCWLWGSKGPWWGTPCGKELWAGAKSWRWPLANSHQGMEAVSPTTTRNWMNSANNLSDLKRRSFLNWASDETAALISLQPCETFSKGTRKLCSDSWATEMIR